MTEKIYLNLLILCGILCQGIIATFSVEDRGEQSNFLVRKKRVINLTPGQETTRFTIEELPYVVNIKKQNSNHCVGSILSRHTVITAAHCAYDNKSMYKVFSGSANSNDGVRHNVTAINILFHGDRDRIDGIALMKVNPSFVFSHKTLPIHLHEEPLMPDMIGVVSGWGILQGRQVEHPEHLRAILLPIIRHQACVTAYRGRFEITEKDICAYSHLGSLKCCGNSDGGAPLVVNNSLAGVYIWSEINRPSIFVAVQHVRFREWIRSSIMHE